MMASPLRALPFWIDENLRGHPFYIRSATWTKTRDGPALKLGSEVGCGIFFSFCELNKNRRVTGKIRDGQSTVNGNIFLGGLKEDIGQSLSFSKEIETKLCLNIIFQKCQCNL